MSSPARDWIAALRNSHERLASLVRPLDRDLLTRRSCDSGRSIAQMLSHLGSGAEIAQLTLAAALSGTTVNQAAHQPIRDAWHAKGPLAQAADCLAADEAHVSRFEQLTDAELAAIRYEFPGMALDAAGLARLRLSEHALHTWDVAVALDPVRTPAAVTGGPADLDRVRAVFPGS